MRGLLLGLVLLFATTAFARDSVVRPDAPVAVIGQTAITKAELAGYWFDRYPQDYARTLDELVDERLARGIARTQEIVVPASALSDAINKEVAARTKLVQEVFGPKATLTSWVQEGYGIDVATWKRDVLRPRLESVLLKKRIVRLHSRAKLRVHARIIVTFERSKADRVMQKLRQGADFSLVALAESEDATKKVGGTLPPIARGDLAHFPVVEARVFGAAAGALLGPWRVMVEGKPQFQIYKIVRRDEPWRVTGAGLRTKIEADVAKTPVTQAELESWKRHVRRVWGVRYLRPDGGAWK